MPSWCPRWDSFKNGDSRFDTGLEDTPYSAAKDSAFQFSEPEDIGRIKVGGFIFDVVERGFEYVDEGGVLEDPSLQLRMLDVYMDLLMHIEIRSSKQKPVYKDILEAFSSMCTATSPGENQGANCLAFMNTAPDIHVLSQASPESTGGDPDEFDSYTADATMERRRFFITKMGYVGIGPKALDAGDMLYFVWG